MVPVGVEIRRGSARFAERASGRATWHSFSFGASYDPDNLGFGPMVCHDDHWLGRGEGFETHSHRDLVIVTWVVNGELTHTDPSGTRTVSPGQVAVLRTGSGVEHAEIATAAQTRFVQVWLTPDEPGGAASYDVTEHLPAAGLTLVAQPTALASFSVARPSAGESVTLPDDDLQHVYVARGALTRSSMAEPLTHGDAFRITRTRTGDNLTGVELTAAVPTELLVWGLRGVPR